MELEGSSWCRSCLFSFIFGGGGGGGGRITLDGDEVEETKPPEGILNSLI